MKRLTKFLTALALASALAGCGTADPPIVKDGCTVNPKKVCAWMLDNAPPTTTDGLPLTHQQIQNVKVGQIAVCALAKS
jgi:hypothetical protein